MALLVEVHLHLSKVEKPYMRHHLAQVFLMLGRQEVKLGYCAKVNGRSAVIGPEYVAIIRPLY